MKRFVVTLDPTKCVSYTLPDGRKFLPGRSKVMSGDDIELFKSAGVFLIEEQYIPEKLTDQEQPSSESGEVKESVPDKKVRFKKRKVVSPEINPDDKLDVEKDKEDFVK